MCLKIAYPNQHAAIDKATRQANHYGILPQLPYWCKECRLWHLTCKGDPARKLPERQAVVEPEPEPEPTPEKNKWLQLAHDWYREHEKELKKHARFGNRRKKRYQPIKL